MERTDNWSFDVITKRYKTNARIPAKLHNPTIENEKEKVIS